MTNLTNRHRAFFRKSDDCQLSAQDEKNEARAFAEWDHGVRDHGTGITLFQFPSSSESATLPTGKPERNIKLPESYATVPAVGAKTSEVTVPETSYTEVLRDNLQAAMVQEERWAEHAGRILDKEIGNNDVLSWSSYHGSLNRVQVTSPVISELLPLFYEKASSLAMVKHGMEMQKKATEYLNPGQIPITGFD